jgi:large subunit ribosomal protein L25
MSEVLQVAKRDTRGTRHARRQRQAGQIPAILYGHGKESISLTIDEAEMATALRHNARLVELAGDVTEKALIRDIQWDTYGVDVLHVDLTRVAADERIQVNVAVELRGDAPGVKEGGVVEHMVHELEIECFAESIPEKLEVNINSLNVGESLQVSTIELPDGVKVLVPDETVIVQCVEAQVEEELEETLPGAVEPEVIGRKAEDEGEGGAS